MDQIVGLAGIELQAGPTTEELLAEATQRERFEEADFLCRLGSAMIGEKHFEAAIATLGRALRIMPEHGPTWGEIGVAYHAMGRFDESVKALERCLQLAPSYDNARSNLAMVKGILGDHETAETIMRSLMEIPERNDAEIIHLALMLLANGDWRRGLAFYDRRVGVKSKEFRLPKLGAPYWDGSDLNGKSIYIATEQGIGDTIATSRYVAWLKQAYPDVRIKLNSHQSYTNLLWEFRSIVDFFPSGVLWPEGDEAFDCGVYLMSLMRFAGAAPDNIFPDPGLIRKRIVEQRTACPLVNMPLPKRKGARKVGIVWTGNPEQSTNARRSVPLEQLLYLASDPDNTLYSFQCGAGVADLKRLGAEPIVEDLSAPISVDLVNCGCALMEMDALVTCCTSVAHLAGALGVPTFLMLCREPFWLWGNKPTTTAWYPSVRLFRQRTRGDWNEVIHDISAALKELAT